MNKAELVNAMAIESGLTKVDCQKALDALIKSVEKTLKSGEKVALVGFGTFSVSERAAHEAINPFTKQKIEISAKKRVKFKAGSNLIFD